MEASFAVPGFEIDRLVGVGGSGQVWRAREQATGDIVALKRLLPSAQAGGGLVDPAAGLRRLRHEAALLAGLRHPHLLRLRRVVPAPDGVVLVLDFAAGGSLAAVIASRGPLPAGEVVAVAAPIAEALGYLHGAGLVHGDVSPANIVFDAAGTPLLADFGVARLDGDRPPVDAWTPGYADPAGAAGSASDVHGLAAVCYAALAGRPPYADTATARPPLADLARSAPVRLVAAIESALAANPMDRPAAGEFACALRDSCPSEPIRLPQALAPPPLELGPPTHVRPRALPATAVGESAEPAAGSRGRPMRTVIAISGAVAVVGVAVLIGIGWAAHGRHAAAAASSPPVAVGAPRSAPAAVDPSASVASGAGVSTPVTLSPSAAGPSASGPAAVDGYVAAPPVSDLGGSSDWKRVIAALDAARDQAFEDADPVLLDGVYLPGSPAGAADRRTLGHLVAAGEHARGLHPQLISVDVDARTPDRVVLRVSDTLPGYDVVAADGTSVHQPGRGERSWIVTLGSAGAAWRIATVAPAG